MKHCPTFICLDSDEEVCNKYPACDGCDKLYSCQHCANQSTLINGSTLACDMINILPVCRSCLTRSSPDFDPQIACARCPHYLNKLSSQHISNQ